ncbi:exodeoxyribonuclease III [Demetria terragena]|uniref:exodeoxyribonuclease III n=1 Tax=Demetria terragena TaxID=63959 RepID=UPI000370CED3|nr:exodeoxyribonuclease III [Demetria terragena]
MRIATFNINGIRAAQRRGFDAWLAERGADVVTLQEVRAPVEALPEGVFGDYHLAYDPGSIAGRNGVAVLTRQPPAAVRTWSGSATLLGPGEPPTEVDAEQGTLARGMREFSDEGRYLEVDLADQLLTVASLYLPKGGLPAHLQKPGRMREAPDGGAKYDRKMRFLDAFARQLKRSRLEARARGREFVLTGDLNIAHLNHDVANWRRSQQSEGFLPEEREWLDQQLSPRTLVDVLRAAHPDADGPYTWWSWLGRAFEKDVGWRIDYQLATPALAKSVIGASVDREPSREERRSDHAALVVDYQWT